MFLVSGPELVIEACKNGVIGAFPTANCRTVEQLGEWFTQIYQQLHTFASSHPDLRVAPLCANLIVHRSNSRLQEDLELVRKHRVEIVIASVGSPHAIIDPIHDYGGLIFTDVASMQHVEKAVAAGTDGLILLAAGAGGQTGWANPFAFVRQVREVFDGPVVLAGGVADGTALYAAEVLGCDLAYMGTRFIASRESLAAEGYKRMIVDSGMDDITLTRAFTGLETNMIRQSIEAAGLDPDSLPKRDMRDMIDVSKDLDPANQDKRRYRDIWSAGHTAGSVHDVPTVHDLVDRLKQEYEKARGA
jgi:nitronate monooxygenase